MPENKQQKRDVEVANRLFIRVLRELQDERVDCLAALVVMGDVMVDVALELFENDAVASAILDTLRTKVAQWKFEHDVDTGFPS